MKLSKHFELHEFLKTSKGLPAIPSLSNIKNMELLCVYILEPARVTLGFPVRISSGLRSRYVNMKVGGSSTSQHLTGKAADLVCQDNVALFEFIKKCCVFDQLIWEGGNCIYPAWVHVSFNINNNRMQIIYNYESK